MRRGTRYKLTGEEKSVNDGFYGEEGAVVSIAAGNFTEQSIVWVLNASDTQSVLEEFADATGMSESELLEMVDEGRCVVFSDVADVDGEPLVFRSSDVINEIHEASLAIMGGIPASEYIYFLKKEYEDLVDDGFLSDDAKNVSQMFNRVDSCDGIDDIILEKILCRFEKDITEEIPNKFYASVNGENASDYAFDNSPSGGASEMRDYVNIFRRKVEEESQSSAFGARSRR